MNVRKMKFISDIYIILGMSTKMRKLIFITDSEDLTALFGNKNGTTTASLLANKVHALV